MRTPAIVIGDCEFGFEHPPGHLELCVPIIPPQPPQVVPTLDTWALIGLLVMICVLSLVWIWKRRYD